MHQDYQDKTHQEKILEFLPWISLEIKRRPLLGVRRLVGAFAAAGFCRRLLSNAYQVAQSRDR